VCYHSPYSCHKVQRAIDIISDIYSIAKGISEQGAKVTFIQQSSLNPLSGEDIEEDIAFCHLNH
jgi:hypothetical protein